MFNEMEGKFCVVISAINEHPGEHAQYQSSSSGSINRNITFCNKHKKMELEREHGQQIQAQFVKNVAQKFASPLGIFLFNDTSPLSNWSLNLG